MGKPLDGSLQRLVQVVADLGGGEDAELAAAQANEDLKLSVERRVLAQRAPLPAARVGEPAARREASALAGCEQGEGGACAESRLAGADWMTFPPYKHKHHAMPPSPDSKGAALASPGGATCATPR